jgi:hypothetical protein
MGQSKSKKRGRNKRLSTVNPNAAGIDVGSQFHVVAVPADRNDEPVRTFQSFTGSITRLSANFEIFLFDIFQKPGQRYRYTWRNAVAIAHCRFRRSTKRLSASGGHG